MSHPLFALPNHSARKPHRLLAAALTWGILALPFTAHADKPTPKPTHAKLAPAKPLPPLGSVRALSAWVATQQKAERQRERAEARSEKRDQDRSEEERDRAENNESSLVSKRTASGRAIPFRQEKEEGGLDFLEAYLFRIQQRAFPNDKVDWEAYKRAAAHRERMPAFHLDTASNGAHSSAAGGGISITSGSQWQFAGPVNFTDHYQWGYGVGAMIGRVNDLAYDPSNVGTYYAATSGGGVWKTTNGGANWNSLSDQWPFTQTSVIALQPGNSNVVYVGTGDYNGQGGLCFGIMKSTNGGATWTNLGKAQFGSVSVSRIAIDPENPQTVIVTTGRGSNYEGYVWRSTDGGVNWTKVISAIADWNDLRFGAKSSGNVRYLYAVGNDNGTWKIYRSADRGATFTPLSYPPVGGVNWYDMSTLATSPTDPNGVYLCSGSNNNVYHSTDAGASWTFFNTPPGASWDQQWYDQHLECATRIINGTPREYVYLSLIGVFSWNSTTGWETVCSAYTDTDPIHVDQHALTVNPANSNEMLVGSDGGAYRLAATANTNTWTPTSLNATLGNTEYYHLAAHPTDPYDLMAGAQDNGTSASRGNFNTWELVSGGDGADVAINQVNPLIQYNCYVYLRGLTVTTDNWNNVFTNISPKTTGENIAFIAPFTLAPGAQNLLYAGTNYVHRYDQTTNTWTYRLGSTKLSTSSYLLAVEIAPTDNNRLYTGSADGEVWTSGNGGTSWMKISAGLPARSVTSISVDPTTPTKVLVGLSGTGSSHLYRCDNTAAATPTWINVGGSGAAALPDIALNCIARDLDSPLTSYYVGTDAGVFATTDSGATWQNATTPLGLPNVQVDELVAVPGTRFLNAGTYGRGIWRLSLATTPTVASLTVAPTSVTGGSNTTVTGTVTLSAAAPAGGQVVTLSSNNTSAATVPASVTVAATQTTATFAVTHKKVAADASVTLTATVGSSSQTATLLVKATAAAAIQSLTVIPTSVIGGTNATGTVTLSAPAPAGGQIINLSSSNTGAATVPATVLVSTAATKTTFVVTTKPVTSPASVTITASNAQGSVTAPLTVRTSDSNVSSLTLSPPTAIGGGAVRVFGIVTLNNKAPSTGKTVTLSSSDTSAATVPTTIVVGANSRSAAFSVTTKPVSATKTVTITATGGATATATLTLTAPTLTSFTLIPDTAQGGDDVTGILILSGPLASTLNVKLTSSNPSVVPLPASINLAAGTTASTLRIFTRAVTVSTPVTITVQAGSVTLTATLTVNP